MEDNKKIKLEIELSYNPDLWHGKDKDAIDWFFNYVLKDKLFLHSNEVGDTIGKVKILSYARKK